MARHRQSRGAIAREVAEQSLKRQDSTKATRLERIKWREDGGHIIEFGHIYLPHIFTAPSAEFHREICAALATLSRVVRAAPRGHAKTQVATLANTLYLIVTFAHEDLIPKARQQRSEERR